MCSHSTKSLAHCALLGKEILTDFSNGVAKTFGTRRRAMDNRYDTSLGTSIRYTFKISCRSCPLEGMCLGREHVLVQADEVWRRENQVEVLECLGQPKALHLRQYEVQCRSKCMLTYLHRVLLLGGPLHRDILDSRMTKRRFRALHNTLKHPPSNFPEFLLTRDTVHYENTLDGLRT